MHTPSTGPSSPEIGRLSLVSSTESLTARSTDDASPIIPDVRSLVQGRSSHLLPIIQSALESKLQQLEQEKLSKIAADTQKYRDRIQRNQAAVIKLEDDKAELETTKQGLETQMASTEASIRLYNQLSSMSRHDLRKGGTSKQEVQEKLEAEAATYLALERQRDSINLDIFSNLQATTRTQGKIMKDENAIAQQEEKHDQACDIQRKTLITMIARYNHH